MIKFTIITLLSLFFYAGSAQAYVGPGLGVGVIGAIVGVVLTVVMALIGVFWYPLKRLFKKNSEEMIEEDDSNKP